MAQSGAGDSVYVVSTQVDALPSALSGSTVIILLNYVGIVKIAFPEFYDSFVFSRNPKTIR